jgi:hypothetical protein
VAPICSLGTLRGMLVAPRCLLRGNGANLGFEAQLFLAAEVSLTSAAARSILSVGCADALCPPSEMYAKRPTCDPLQRLRHEENIYHNDRGRLWCLAFGRRRVCAGRNGQYGNGRRHAKERTDLT